MRRILLLFAVLVMAAGRGSAAPAAPRPAPALLVLATRGESTQLVRVSLAARVAKLSEATTLATLSHAHDGAVRGALAADGSAWIMTETSARDHSFTGALVRITPNGAKRVLRNDLAYASSPLVVGNAIFVQTGRPGVLASPRRMRDDEVAINMLDANHPEAPAHELIALRGQLAFPISVDAHAGLLAYLVGPPGTPGDGGRLVAIDLASHALHDLGAVGTARDLSYARSLVVDGRALGPAVVYETPAAGGSHVVRARLLDGTVRELMSDHRPLAPRLDAAGALHTSTLVDGAFEVARVLDERATALQRYLPDGSLPSLIVRGDWGATEIVADPQTRLEPIGFVERLP
jgi:hypothetical protein